MTPKKERQLLNQKQIITDSNEKKIYCLQPVDPDPYWIHIQEPYGSGSVSIQNTDPDPHK